MKKLLIVVISILAIEAQGQTSNSKRGDSLYLNGNYSKAIEAYQKNEDQSQLYDRIAKAYIAVGNYDAALDNYENSIAVNPKDALIKYEYAKLLAKTKKYQKASDEFYKLIDIDYRNPNYHYELGLVLEHLKDSTAQNRFFSAFQLDSTHQKTIFRIARFHVKKRHHKTANKYIDIGLSSYANNKDLISLKAQNYYWKEDYDNATIWFEKLIELNESTQFIHEKLSFCYVKIYEYEKAIEQGLIALEFESKNPTNLYILGQLYQKMEDFEKAEEYILSALKIWDVPLNSEYSKLANVYNRQKKYKEAIDAYKLAIQENPKIESSQFFLVYTKGRYYEDIDTRIKLFENFIIKFPKSMFKTSAEHRIKELKEEKFLEANKSEDSIQKTSKN